jgi:hypothetical protein
MKRILVLALLAVPALLGSAACARAEPIWSYSWSASPGVVTSDDGSLGKVTFLPGSGGPISGSVDSGNGILAASLVAVGPAQGVATFTSRDYSLTMHLTDLASHTSGDFTFHGALSGTTDGTHNLTNVFQGPISQTQNLGGNLYTVTAGLFIPPQPSTPGRIGANVSVVAGQGPPPVSVPEPTCLLLAGVGLSALGARAWWRKRFARI